METALQVLRTHTNCMQKETAVIACKGFMKLVIGVFEANILLIFILFLYFIFFACQINLNQNL